MQVRDDLENRNDARVQQQPQQPQQQQPAVDRLAMHMEQEQVCCVVWCDLLGCVWWW